MGTKIPPETLPIDDLERLRFAIDNHAIVSIADAVGTIVYANDRFCAITGYAREELLGKNHRILKSGYHLDSYYTHMWETISNGKVWRGEVCNKKKDGSLYWVDTSITPFCNDYSVAQRYVSIRTDITALKRAQQALQASEAQFRGAFEYAPVGMCLASPDGELLRVNHELCVMLGYAESELNGAHFCEITHPDDLVASNEVLLRVVRGETNLGRINKRYLRKSGDVVWGQVHLSCVRDVQHHVTHVVVQIEDVTARRLLEQAVRDSEILFRQLAENITEVFFVREAVPNGKMIYVSPAYEATWGRSLQSIYADPRDFMNAVHPDDVEHIAHQFAAKQSGGFDEEYRIVRPDGSVRWVRTRNFPVADENGSVYRIAGFAEDITERRAMEEELRHAREAAEAASQAKTEFLSRMSHELRTPLNAILGFAQILEADTVGLTSDHKECVTCISKAGWHLLSLITDVLDLAKIEAGRLQVDVGDVYLDEVVHESVSMVEPLAHKSAIQLSLGSSLTNVRVRADELRLRQVLINLLSNAVKYNRPKGSVRVDCALDQASGRVRVTVHDTGMGIDTSVRDQLFVPFNRLGRDKSGIDGTGIGLVIAKRLLEMMGGAIGVDSQVGVGSAFWIELVVCADAAQTETSSATSEPIRRIVKPSEKEEVVLYVEDNPASLRLMEVLMARRKSVRLMTAPRGLIGLELARAHRPDLILLDINLPDIHGYELLKLLRADEKFMSTPVIAVSADALPHHVANGLASGFNHYVTKPINMAEFNMVLDAALGLGASGASSPR